MCSSDLMREAGLEAMAVVSHAALLGTSDNIHPCADYGELMAHFDLAKISRAPARFDEAELRHLNARLLHHLPWQAVRARLPGLDEGLWMALRGNIETLGDTDAWVAIIRDGLKPPAMPEETSFLVRAAALLPPMPWSEETWKAWTATLKAETGRTGKALFLPLRLALTGREHGPEMARLLPLIGREKALERLAALAHDRP